MITIKHLTIFKEVAHEKSMSKAAKNLYISQPTVSQKIQEIEDYYHIKLFQRNAKTLAITEEGKIFLKYTNRILDELDEIDDIFFHNKETITIRIGATSTVGCTIMPKLLNSVRERNPNINFQVTVENTQYIENMIAENKLDIAIIEGDIVNQNIIKEPIIPDQLVFVAKADHPLTKYKSISVDQLENYPFILREKGSGTRARFDQFMNKNKITYHTSWVCHSWESIKQALLNDFGITVISVHLIEEELNSGEVQILNVEGWNCNRMFSICYHQNKPLNDNLKLIIEESRNYLQCPIVQYIKKNQV